MKSQDLADASATSGAFRVAHKIFSVYEILGHIFSYSEKQDLAVAARVSWLWNDVALDELWRELESVFPLLEILSPIVETDEECEFSDGPLRWERFQNYARRVRCLTHNDAHPYKLQNSDDDVYPVRLPRLEPSGRLGSDPLLPQIREISWSVEEEIANLPWILSFISPSLKLLTIELHAQGPAVVDVACEFFLTLLPFVQLELESFKFERNEMELEIVPSLGAFLLLRSNLKVLDIACDPYIRPCFLDPLFVVLPKSLQELHLQVEFHERRDYIARIQSILQRLGSLRVLELVLSGIDSWNPSDFESLSPFLHNPNMEELTLWVAEEIHLNPRDIYTLGRALPKMARLNLRLHYSLGPALYMPASSLMDFAKAFPHLETLYFRITIIDVSLPLPPPDEAGRICSFNPGTFRFLGVGDSPLSEQDVPCMSAYLRMLCGHPLVEIRYEKKGLSGKGPVPPWEKVATLVRRNLSHGV